VGVFSNFIEIKFPDVVVCLLLFAMGLQNSFVTKISNAVVRTTHLTGLFTDLGIEMAQLFIPSSHQDNKKLKATIKLRIYIILSFFTGGLISVFFYTKLQMQLNTLLIAAFILIASLFYDDVRFTLIKAKRKHYKKG
jgi:uncharacterized membrane protein YoaK (UPF0700 family)